MDADGYYYIVDRKKDLIIRGGYNVYPREIEEVLYEHPAVAEAAVVGMPHPELGEEVGAAVALKPGATVTPDELRSYVKSQVAAYKYPRQVWIVDALAQRPHREDSQEGDHRAGCGGYWMTTSTAPSVTPEEAAVLADQAAPLDALLVDAALGSGASIRTGPVDGQVGCRTRPQTAHHRPAAGCLVAETGTDRNRHVDGHALEARPPLRRRGLDEQSAAAPRRPGSTWPRAQTADELVADADLDWRDEQRMRFLTENLVEARRAEQRPAGQPGVGQGS